MKIGFATVDWSFDIVDPATMRPAYGGAGYYRINLPARACAAAGHEVVIGGLVVNDKTMECAVQEPTEVEWLNEDDERYPEFRKGSGLLVPLWTGEISHDCDVIVLQRWMWFDLAPRLQRARAIGQVIVNDIDDWFWGLDQRNVAWRATHPKYNYEINVEHYRDVLAASTVITSSTPYLTERLHKMLPDTPIITLRNMIDSERWGHDRVEREQPTIGWVGGTPWRSGDLETMKGILKPFLDAHPEVGCFHGGDAPDQISFAESIGLDPERVATMPLSPTFAVPALYDPIDIGIVPLTMQPFNFAKSCIKGYEYTASGAAFIAAPTPEYEWARSAGMGFTAKKPKDWRRYMEHLLDPEVRAKAVAGARNFLDTQTVEARGEDWPSTYEAMS